MISFRAVKLYSVVILSAIILFVFLPGVGNDFVDWDDPTFVLLNPNIASISMSSLCWMLTTGYAGAWHPLTWLSHALDVALWGLEPSLHHLVSILIHVLNVASFFFLCGKLQKSWSRHNPLGERLPDEVALVAAFVAALLFGLHPLRVESVIWISERKDVLCALFYIWSLVAYLNYVEKNHAASQARSYWLSIGLFALALLAKPMAVTLPLVLLVLDYFPLYRIEKASVAKRVWEKAPFIVLATAAATINIAVKWTTTVPLTYVPAHMRLMNAFHSVVFYICQTAWPLNLLPIYQMDRNLDYLGPRFVLSALAVALITAFCLWRAARKARLWAATWFYYIITLGPALGFFMPYRHAAADRYTYLPTMGMWLLVGVGAARLWEVAGRLRQPLAARIGLAAGVLLAACAYGFQTQKQIGVWKNSETLWTHTIEHAEYVPDLAYFGIGKVFEERGQFDAALANYQAGLALNPLDNRYRRKIAWVLAQKGDTDKALELIRENVQQEPRNPSAHVNMGKILALMGRYEEAAQSAKTALALDPEFEPAFDLLMVIYLEQNDLAAARVYYKKRISKGYSVPKEIEERLGASSRGGRPLSQ